MKKRLLAAVMVAVMSVTMLPGMAFAEEASDLAGAVSETCILTEGCTLDAGHDGECILNTESGGNEPENEDENVPGSEAEGEKDPVSCTLTEGCVLEEGHTGECSVPATMQLAPKAPADDGINTPEEFKSALEQGGTVTLSGSVTLEEGTAFSISKEVVIDLNGNSITREGESSKPLFSVKSGGALTLNDTTGTGGVYSSYPFQLYSGSQMTVNGGTVISSEGAALDIFTSASDVKVEINGGTFSVKEGNSDNVFGIRGSKNVVVDIKGGEFQGTAGNRLAMYVSGDKDGAITLNISGGSVKSEGQAIQAYSGAVINVSGSALIHSESGVALSTQSGYGVVELNVTGGTVSSNGYGYAIQAREKSKVAISGGTVTGNTAVYADDNASVTVTGGSVKGKKAAIGKDNAGSPQITVTGGSFSHNVKDYVPQGMTVEQGADGSFIVTKLKTVYAGGSGAADTNSGAESGKAVKTLKKALELVEEGGTVIVQGQLEIKEDMTLDKVTIKRGAGCTGNMLYVSGSYTLTLKNVTIDGSKGEVSLGNFAPLVYVRAGATLNIEEGAMLKNNAFAAVRGDDQSEVNMSGGIITGNASENDGGGILMYGGTLNLTGGEISGNSSERAGGGVCYLGKGTVNLSGTKILKNSANRGGGVYIEGMSGEAVLTMTGGEIRENSLRLMTDPDDPSYHWLADGAGICAWGNNGTSASTKVIVRGGIISDNIVTNDQAEDPGVGAAISLNHSEETSPFPELTLGGNPVIDGDIALWDEETASPVIQVEEGFAHEGPIEVWVNWGTEGVTAARFPNTMTAAGAEALFSSAEEHEELMLAAEGTELKWLELVGVSFKSYDNNSTYKKCYLRPGSLIDSSLAPLENGQEGVVRPEEGYTLAGWVRYGKSELWNFAENTVPEDKSTMSLLAVWGPEAPKVLLTADKTSVHVKGSFTLTAKAEHPLQNVTYQYEWYRDGQKIDKETAATLVTDAPGSYTVQVKAVKGKLTSAPAVSSAVVCTVTQHEYAAEWKSDGTNHWHACSVCGEKTDMAAHSFKWVTDKEASSSEPGSKHEECSVCGYKKAAVEIPATGGGSSHSHSHGFGTEWKSDGTNHWHECRCGAKTDIAAHTFGKWKITKAPTAVRVGSRERICTVCGYKAVETITLSGTASPQTGDSSHIGLFISLLLLSGTGFAGAVIYRRKKYVK